jgi:hypothetical protein
MAKTFTEARAEYRHEMAAARNRYRGSTAGARSKLERAKAKAWRKLERLTARLGVLDRAAVGSRGGAARAAVLSPTRRREIALNANAARWNKRRAA